MITGGAASIVGASAVLSPSGGDDSATIANALSNFAPYSSPKVVLGPGTFKWNSQVPAFLKNTAGHVVGAGEGLTTIQLSAAAPRAFDVKRTADYDTFVGITIEDFTVDCNNMDPGSQQHVVFGALISQNRLNFDRITVQRITAVNVPHINTGTYGRHAVGFYLSQSASGEATQTSFLGLTVLDLKCYGGNAAVVLAGNPGVLTAGLGVNVYYDRITVGRIYHDTQVTPTATYPDAHVQIGSYGFGDTIHVFDVEGRNSGDVGIEIDGCMNAVLDGNIEIWDARNAPVLFRNFRDPGNVAAQVNRATGVVARTTYDPTTTATGFSLKGDATTAGYIFGTAIFDGCSSDFRSPMAALNTTGGHVFSCGNPGVRFHKLVIRDHTVSANSLAINTATNIGMVWSEIYSTLPGAVVVIDGLHHTFAGTRAGAGTFTHKVLRLNLTNGSADVGRITYDVAALTGLSASDTFYWTMFGSGDFTATMRGTVRDGGATTAPVAGTHYGLFVASTANVTLQRLVCSRNFHGLLSGIGGLDYSVDATQTANVVIRDWLTSRGNAVPLRNATAITVGGSPFTYTNTDMVDENVVVTGGTVSAISAYGIATGQTAGTWKLRPGDTLQVTYTVAPTMTKFPA